MRYILLTCVYFNHACVKYSLHAPYRNKSESDTESTDDDRTWHGLGKHEYAQKVLPHALFHTTEQYMRGGHLQAFCTFAVEQGHKRFIKAAASLTRVYASVNVTQDKMLQCVCEHILWLRVVQYLPYEETIDCDEFQDLPAFKLHLPLNYSKDWCDLRINNSRLPVSWGKQFLSAKVRITRLEFMRILCKKLGIEDSHSTHCELIQSCQFEFWGSVSITCAQNTLKFVGAQGDRRDFVRLRGEYNNTCLSVHLIAFLKISGLQEIISVPIHLLNTSKDNSSITLALVRWLSPHPSAILRDQKQRPVGVPPFDINHAFWKFSEVPRPDLTDDIRKRLANHHPDESHARYDLVLPQSFNEHINCTVVDTNNVMETITLPF